MKIACTIKLFPQITEFLNTFLGKFKLHAEKITLTHISRDLPNSNDVKDVLIIFHSSEVLPPRESAVRLVFKKASRRTIKINHLINVT